MAHDIELGSADGFKFPAYEARPAGPIKGAVVVVQEIFGVNSHIRGIVDAFAVRGYLAVAPAMFHRVKPGVDLGYSGEDVAAGVALKAGVEALPAPGAMQDLQAAVDYASQFGKVGVIGFCWGGLLTWRAACQLSGVTAAIAYYGGGMTQAAEIARHPQCPVMAHFGDQDHAIPMPGVQAFQAAHPEVAVHIYSAGHGFNCNQRGSFDEAAATLARGRSLAFFASHLQVAPAP